MREHDRVTANLPSIGSLPEMKVLTERRLDDANDATVVEVDDLLSQSIVVRIVESSFS